MRRNYFVEGLQGAGRTTFTKRLSDYLQDYQAFQEGDYSPVELAWCSYVTEEQYGRILEKYPMLSAEIKAQTMEEGNLDKDAFEKLILERFGSWDGEGQIFECSVFQNIIENQMLYLLMSDGEILDFYRRLKSVLGGRDQPDWED